MSRFTAACGSAWSLLCDCALGMKPCRVPILLVSAGLAFLLLASQGEDVVRALAERRTGDGAPWQVFWFFTASLAWSLSAWYWARVMLLVKLPGLPEKAPGLLVWLRAWAPRLLGFLATLGVALAFCLASLGYAAGEHADVRSLLRSYAVWTFIGAVAFLVAVSVRRTVSRAVYRRVKIEALNLPKKNEQPYGALDFKDLGRLTHLLLLAAILAACLLFALFVLAPQRVAPAMGSAAILLLAAAGWIAAGSTLDFAGMRLRFPAFTALVLVVVLFSLWNDNHAVRTLPDPQPAQRLDLKESLQLWMVQHKAKLARSKGPVPLYLVDAEGGGIRAAYWTVSVLGEIQRRNPCFAEHLFSLSGVSGGSLGASVFVALLAQSREQGAPARCDAPAAKHPFDLKDRAQAVLGEDFLAPVVAGLLYPELAQHFLPWPEARFDRAALLEQAWEGAWGRHVPGRNRMKESLDHLYQDKRWTPALFLNATWVETGKRIIVSNVRVAAAKGIEWFVDTEDALAFYEARSLSLSTAAHLSARFTYVSPAGTLVKGGKAYGRVVDGGYFENSGATTTHEILKAIDLLAAKDPDWDRVERFVIHISNEPVDPELASDRLAGAPDNELIRPRRLLNEALSPLRTMLNTRNARGMYARETVMWHVGADNYLHFGLCRRSTNVPLGWVLSRSTRERMEAQLTKDPCIDRNNPKAVPVFDNPANLKKIEARLR